jgi:hypothetical protein
MRNKIQDFIFWAIKFLSVFIWVRRSGNSCLPHVQPVDRGTREGFASKVG